MAHAIELKIPNFGDQNTDMEQNNQNNSQSDRFGDITRKAFDEITKKAEAAWGKLQKEFDEQKEKNGPEIEAWKKKAATLWDKFEKEASVSYQTAKEKFGPQMESFLKEAKETLNKANGKAEEFAEKARREFNQWKKGKDDV